MTKFLAVCLVLLITLLVVTAQEHGSKTPPSKTSPTSDPAGLRSWVRVDSDDGQFSILLPEMAADRTETTPNSQYGAYTTHLLRAEENTRVYLVGWVDYDPSFNFTVQSELMANRDNFVKGIKGTLLSTTKIELDGHPGLEFSAETPDVAYKSRVYLVGRRPIILVAGARKGDEDPVTVARFFKSFQIKLP